MKIRCERDVLVETLSTAARAVATRATNIPAIAGLHLEAKNDKLLVTGTDLDLTSRVTTDVTVSEEGQCVIPARLLTDIVRSMSSGAVVIEKDEADHEAKVSGGRSQFVVRTLEVSDFPKIERPESYNTSLGSKELADALRQVVRAASSDDARPVLTGVLLSAEGKGLRLVATDSYRLAVRDVPGADVLTDEQSMLIPSKALSELTKLLESADGDIQVAFNEKKITFSVGKVLLTSRLIEGQFPDYKPLIPDSYPNRLHIDRDVLLESVRRVKLLVKDMTTPVRMALRTDGAELTVVSHEIGTATEDVEAKYEGESMTVAFNPAYLIDGLESVPPGEVLIETIDALKPATLKAHSNDTFLYLIMPVRVS